MKLKWGKKKGALTSDGEKPAGFVESRDREERECTLHYGVQNRAGPRRRRGGIKK